MLDRSREADKQSVTYQHIDGKLYRSRNCLFPARCEGVEYFLSRAVKESNMPDFELVLNVHDWPIVNKYIHRDSPLPTFSFSKTADYFDIFFPAWTFWAGGECSLCAYVLNSVHRSLLLFRARHLPASHRPREMG